MRRKKTDGGLVIVGLVLIGIGSYALVGGELFFSPIAPREGQGWGGVPALMIGAAFVAGGVYFLLQSRK
ncbi:MAG: hypothetical protein ACQETK_09940 [Pseudomonadota bacterium]